MKKWNAQKNRRDQANQKVNIILVHDRFLIQYLNFLFRCLVVSFDIFVINWNLNKYCLINSCQQFKIPIYVEGNCIDEKYF